jgi:hypothetical protein
LNDDVFDDVEVDTFPVDADEFSTADWGFPLESFEDDNRRRRKRIVGVVTLFLVMTLVFMPIRVDPNKMELHRRWKSELFLRNAEPMIVVADLPIVVNVAIGRNLATDLFQ